MKKTIPFDKFGEKQELCFTIPGVGALERTLGRTIPQIYATRYFGFDFTIAAIAIALPDITMAESEEKITKYLTEKKGRGLKDIAEPLIDAIAISGAFGVEPMERVEKRYYPELFKKKDKETAEKNG